MSHSSAQNSVITTVTHFLDVFQSEMEHQLPNQTVIFDDGLSYRTAMEKIRAHNNYYGTNRDPLPCLAYKRTVLNQSKDRFAGARFKNYRLCHMVDGTPLEYKGTYGEFDILFAYFTKDIELQEQFEVAYTNHSGISTVKEFVVDMQELGDFTYYAKWSDLEEYTVKEDEGNHFKSLIGKVTIRGFFFNFRSEAKVIQEVNARIISSRNLAVSGLDEVLETSIINNDNS